MKTEELLKNLSWVTNRSLNQTKELFHLCDYSFEKLLELEAKMKKHFVRYSPGDKQEVDKLLNLPL